MRYQVIVGNIGTTYDGNNMFEATADYNHYVRLSAAGQGRAGDETVTLMEDDEVSREFVPGRKTKPKKEKMP